MQREEGDEEDGEADEEADDPTGRPGGLETAFLQSDKEADHGAEEEERSAPVHPGDAARDWQGLRDEGRLAEQDDEDGCQCAGRCADVEDPPPADLARQRAADERSDDRTCRRGLSAS